MLPIFTTAWALLYWNFRKASFRLRGRHGPAPCQHPSDSGKAFATACVACATWRDPAKFKKICPLLVDTPHGLKCSVDAKDVRPFWGPLVAFYGQAAALSYLGAVLLVFGFLKTTGYPVALVDLAWPGFWPHVTQARTAFLLQKAKNAFTTGNVREGLLYLQNAEETDPKNYSVGLDLALLYRPALPTSSNAQFESLWLEHPEKRNATALLWLDTSLARADFKNILRLAGTQLKADPAQGNTWAKALIFSAQQLQTVSELQKLQSEPGLTLDPWRRCLALAIAVQERNDPEINSLLREPWRETAPAFATFYALREMAAHGKTFEALDLIQKYPASLDAATKAILVLEILSAAKHEDRVTREVELLLTRQKDPDVIKMLSVHVIRHHDAAVFQRVYAAAKITDPKAARADLWFSLLCAAGAVEDAGAVQEISGTLRAKPSTRTLAIALQDFFEGQSSQSKFAGFLPWLGLSREENYALLENPPAPIRRLDRAK